MSSFLRLPSFLLCFYQTWLKKYGAQKREEEWQKKNKNIKRI
jgi:hypothetical protein